MWDDTYLKCTISISTWDIKEKSLFRSNGKKIFGDYGKEIVYTCAGVQVSWNSRQVLDAAPFMDKLPLCLRRAMMKMMQCAEYAFEAISNHQVISNVHNAKRLVPFKTMKIPSCNDYTPLKYYGGIGFWVQYVSAMPHRFWLHNEHCVYSFKGKRSIQSWRWRRC